MADQLTPDSYMASQGGLTPDSFMAQAPKIPVEVSQGRANAGPTQTPSAWDRFKNAFTDEMQSGPTRFLDTISGSHPLDLLKAIPGGIRDTLIGLSEGDPETAGRTLAQLPLIFMGGTPKAVSEAADAAKATTAYQAGKAAVKAGGSDVGVGAAKIGAGLGAAKVATAVGVPEVASELGIGLPAARAGVRQMAQGAKKGVEAAKDIVKAKPPGPIAEAVPQPMPSPDNFSWRAEMEGPIHPEGEISMPNSGLSPAAEPTPPAQTGSAALGYNPKQPFSPSKAARQQTGAGTLAEVKSVPGTPASEIGGQLLDQGWTLDQLNKASVDQIRAKLGGVSASKVDEVKAWLRQNADDPRAASNSSYASLTSEERQAMRDYTTSDANGINAKLRTNSADDETLAQQGVLDSALSKFTLPTDTTLYRGIRDPNVASSLLQHATNANDGPITDQGFMSMSSSPGVAAQIGKDTGVMMEIKAPKGANIADMKSASTRPEEAELLAKSGSQYEVTGIRKDSVDGKPMTIVQVEMKAPSETPAETPPPGVSPQMWQKLKSNPDAVALQQSMAQQ